ncbi:MAG TPA: YdeI/OmpD-associated family protein [Puia sp.]|nr:YdeI/OmpD-associated family protein [Puia sp.]
MIRFSATILQFDKQGEKTGWSYIKISSKIAQQLKPGNKKSFRVKGKLDDHEIKSVSLLPMGGGDFIMALNGAMRKAVRKTKGAKIAVQIEIDNKKPQPPAKFMECLKDEPGALTFFRQLPFHHQNYFSNWIKSAKTEATKAKRIAHCVTALYRKFNFGQMLREIKKEKNQFLN